MIRGLLWFGCIAVCLSLVVVQGQSQDKKEEKKDDKKIVKKVPPKPSQPATYASVAYGKHERQVLDFYQAKSDKPTPVVLFIHGGGWQGGSKEGVGNVKQFHDVGISVAAINYRYVKNGVEQKIEPPVKAPLEDAARALQFIRSKASEWNIDKKRIGATGGRPAAVRRSGWPSTTTWPTPRATTQSPANRPGSTAPPSTVRKPRSIRRN